MFWLLLGYTVSKLCASPRNSTFFTRLFLLVRGWSLETRLITFPLCETCWTYTTFLPMLTLMYLCLYWSVCVCVLWCFVCPLHLLSLDREKPSVFTNMHYREMWHFVTFRRTSNMEVCRKIHWRRLAPRLPFQIKFTQPICMNNIALKRCSQSPTVQDLPRAQMNLTQWYIILQSLT